ncbi:MAG: hypothetical protein ACR2P3_10550 [Geminicoccaceae bacterium]
MKVLLPIWSIAIASLLAGCTTDDPRKGGLLGGLIGLGGGAYQERVVDEKAALEVQEGRYQQEVEGNERLDQSLAARRALAQELEHEVAWLEREMDGLDAEIAALQREESTTRDDVEKVETNVASLLDDLDRIETEREAHEQAKALGADADQDTDPAIFGEPPREQVSDLRAYIIKLQAAVDALKSTREKRAVEVAREHAD